jgi:alpha-1,2-mannosyltransferase
MAVAVVDRARRAARAHRSTARAVVVAVACAGIALAVGTFAHRYAFTGLALDRAAARSWLHDTGLYAYLSPGTRRGTALPPAAALLVAPAAVLPLGVAGWLLALAGVAALVLALVALVGPVARRYARRRWPAVFAAGALALLAEPVRDTLGRGTLDLLLFGLLTADVVALRRGAWARSRALWWPGRARGVPAGRRRGLSDVVRTAWSTGGWAGVGTGLATALAVCPVVFIGYLALTRQWRAAGTAAGTALVVAAAALLAAPAETVAWLGQVLFRLDRTGPVDSVGNQSLAGVLARLYDSATAPVLLWLAFALLLLAVGLIRARSAHADGDEVAAFTLVGLTVAIVGPVTATHELIWLLPAALVMLDAAGRRRAEAAAARRLPARRLPGAGCAAGAAGTYALVVLAPVWTLHNAVGANAYALALILLVTLLPWRPGAAPAFPVNRWARPPRRDAIPPARRAPAGKSSAGPTRS